MVLDRYQQKVRFEWDRIDNFLGCAKKKNVGKSVHKIHAKQQRRIRYTN